MSETCHDSHLRIELDHGFRGSDCSSQIQVYRSSALYLAPASRLNDKNFLKLEHGSSPKTNTRYICYCFISRTAVLRSTAVVLLLLCTGIYSNVCTRYVRGGNITNDVEVPVQQYIIDLLVGRPGGSVD